MSIVFFEKKPFPKHNVCIPCICKKKIFLTIYKANKLFYNKIKNGDIFMNRIKQLREEKNLNQIELGKIIGVSGQALGMYENEKRGLDTKTASILADFFLVSIDYLLGKSDIRNPEKEINFEPDKIRIGLSMKDYTNITEEQKKQIEDFAKYVLKDNLKNKKNDYGC